jgi:CelD/BcsL family acetyltransferase involved in cellulose biosynthesis
MQTKILCDIDKLAEISGEWENLLERSALSAPTLSPAWMLAWWRVFGPHDRRTLRAALFYEGAKLVGLAPLIERPFRYPPGIPFRRLELLASGEDQADEICSEYIGVIAERGAEESVAQALAAALAEGDLGGWDELSLPAMSGDGVLPPLLAQELRRRGFDARLEVESAAPYIALPATWDAYLDQLPASRRYLVRRSIRDFEAWADGTMRFERAETRADLERGSQILLALHCERWSGEGGGGAMASARFRAFHEEIMPALLDRGALDLRWITVRGEPIAAIYNIVWQGKIHFYQSGRKLDLPKGIRAGIVIHAHAIRAAIEAGLREYDFLGGASRYKMDLAPTMRPLVRLRAARPSMVEAARRTAELALDQARVLRNNVRKMLRRRASGRGEVAADTSKVMRRASAA